MAGKSFITEIAMALAQQKAIKAEDAQALSKDFAGRDIASFEEFLLDEGIVERPTLLRALSAVYEVPSFDVRGYLFNHDMVTRFPKEMLLKHVFLPIEVDEDIIAVVSGNPHDTESAKLINEYVTFEVEFRVGIVRDIIDEIRQYYNTPPDDQTLSPEKDDDDFLDIVEQEI